MLKQAAEFAESSNMFTLNPYQCYVAAVGVKSAHKNTALLMGAGQGKTLVILLMASYLAEHGQPVKIVVLNDVLQAQMVDDQNKILQGAKDIEIVDIRNLSYKQEKNYHFIIDECDAILKEHAIKFVGEKKEIGVYGLAAVHATCNFSIWMSATLNRSDRKLLSEAFDMPAEAIIQFESQH